MMLYEDYILKKPLVHRMFLRFLKFSFEKMHFKICEMASIIVSIPMC